VIESYTERLDPLPGEHQLVLVPNACRDASVEICETHAAARTGTKVVVLERGGWGRAVKAGLAAAEGEILCYTNSARTSAEVLTMMLAYASAFEEVVIKANRRVRDSWVRRFGSVLYNLECRALLNLASWDINGTPKIFPRSFAALLDLSADDDLIDAEFLAICGSKGYPVMEVPLLETERHSGKSTTNLGSAIAMYTGAYRLRRELRERG
jgi:hypothetical protein